MSSTIKMMKTPAKEIEGVPLLPYSYPQGYYRFDVNFPKKLTPVKDEKPTRAKSL
jgi:hypothetical protein